KLVYEAWQRGYRVFRPGTVDEWAPNFDPKLLENISRKGGPISGLSSLSGKGSTFRLTAEVVHTLRRADPRGWLALDDLALEAAYERVAGRVVTRQHREWVGEIEHDDAGTVATGRYESRFNPTDVETWTAEIYNAFSVQNVGGRWKIRATPIGTKSGDYSYKNEGPFGPAVGLRLHEAFQLAQSCKAAQIAGRRDTGRTGRAAMSDAMDRILVPTMTALGFDVFVDARRGHGSAPHIEYLVESDIRPASYSQYGRILLEYVNTGDTYSATIGWDEPKEEWYFGSWGSWLERWENDNPEESADDDPGAEDETSTGYTDCACRDCFDVSMSHALCGECSAAGCDSTGQSDCSRTDAYGVDEPEE
ncbi:MAG: hypothetical protein Q7R41_14145, partial [Phycisphaerales bacterium]|nr:hypothetical protein [Phycisphaerales bacterium]